MSVSSTVSIEQALSVCCCMHTHRYMDTDTHNLFIGLYCAVQNFM